VIKIKRSEKEKGDLYMNTRYLMICSALLALPAMAQETYENARLLGNDLNGTARYVGMGGAMEALGADLSTIRTNPAGIGLYRKSGVNLSFGFNSQADANARLGHSTTKMSFDQAGFYRSMRMGERSFVNFAFNFSKGTNFNYFLSAASKLNDASLGKQAYLKGMRGSLYNGGYSIGPGVKNKDVFYGYADDNPSNNDISRAYGQLDYLYWNTRLVDKNDATKFNYDAANGYDFNRSQHGYIGNYDFNISGNVNDRVYLGLTLGLRTVNYKGYSEYVENLVDKTNKNIGTATVADERKVTGTGFDLSAGVIFRPIEESPFRIGFSVNSPTWYDLKTENYTTILNEGQNQGRWERGKSSETYNFKLFTPWTFGASLGHTIGNFLALGASVTYADYASVDNRYIDGEYVDYYGDTHETSASDKVMNSHAKRTLNGVATVKLGMEYKVLPQVAVRAGYNYVSPAYKKDAFKDGTLNSEGSYYSSAADYTNWKATNRITLGVGLIGKQWSADLAYQYSATNGEFYPFTNGLTTVDPATKKPVTNEASAVSVSNKRHQMLFTVGYRF
jgi:hypothetical protein